MQRATVDVLAMPCSSDTVKVRLLNAHEEVAWENYVGSHPAGLLYYSLRYRDLLKRVVRGECAYLAAFRGQDVVGVLPAFRTDGPYGVIINALPFFGSHGGILATNDATWQALAEAWRRVATAPDVAAAVAVRNPFDEASCTY